MDMKDIARMALSPMTLAAVGGFLGHRYGDKVSIGNKYVAASVGLGAGYLLGRFVQRMIPAHHHAPPQVQLPAQTVQNPDEFDAGVAPTPPLLPWPTSPANRSDGEGSYGNTSYDVSGVENAVSEAMQIMANRRNHG